jgi:hypothetical protein
MLFSSSIHSWVEAMCLIPPVASASPAYAEASA